MTVESIEAIPIETPIRDGRGYGSSRGTKNRRATTLVKVTTTDGTVGWGEAFAPPEPTVPIVESMIADEVIGADPHVVESLTERAYTGTYHFGRSAFYHAALSGIDIALWDIIGKQTGRPIHKLLGGRSRKSVTPYASTMYVTEHGEDPADPARRAAAEGFTAAKIKIGRGVEDDIQRVETAREHLGDDAHLMVDFNGNYRVDQAVRSIRELEPYDLTWVEEPVPPEDLDGYRELASHVDVPLAAGEAHFSRFEFADLADVVDIIQPNIGRCGGFSEGRAIATTATTENVAVRPHVWNSGVGVAAALQFLASVPDYPHSTNVPEPVLFECDRSDNPLRSEILETPFDPTGGKLAVPQEPGLGVSVDEDAIAGYRID